MISRQNGIRIGIFATAVGFLFAEPLLMIAGIMVLMMELPTKKA